MSDSNGNGSGMFQKIIIGVIVGAICWLGGWTFQIAGLVSGLSAVQNEQRADINQLETGTTTPMSAEARATFNAVFDRLARIETKIDRLDDDRRKP